MFWMGLYILLFLPTMFAYGGETGTTPLSEPGKINNPLKFSTIQGFIKAILEVVMTIGIPIAVFFIIYSGFLFVTAQGDETQLKKAKETLKWALIGTAVLLGAWVLATAVEGTIKNITG